MKPSNPTSMRDNSALHTPETEEQRQSRLDQNARRKAAEKAAEAPEKRKRRLAADKERKRRCRANGIHPFNMRDNQHVAFTTETLEQQAHRRAKRRVHMQLKMKAAAIQQEEGAGIASRHALDLWGALTSSKCPQRDT